jgi:hypothetical protein
VLPYGSSSDTEQVELLQQVSTDLPPWAKVRVPFYGDCEFRSVEVQRWCQSYHWHWQVGIKSDTYFRPPSGRWQWLSDLGLQQGQRLGLQGVFLTKQEFGPVNLIADWTHQLTTQSDDVLARAGGLHGEPRPRPTPGPRTL